MEKVAESEITFSVSIVSIGSGGEEKGVTHGLVPCKQQVPRHWGLP
jgi:hypothetical protein